MLCPIGAITPVGGVLLIAGLDSPLVFVAARQTLALVLSFDRASACVPVYLFVCVCLLRIRVLCVVCAFSVCRLCMCVACALSLWSTDGQPWSCRDTSSAPILRGWCQLAIAHRPALGVKNSGALSTASALPCKIIHTSRAGSLVCSVCTILRREGTVHNIRQYIVYLRV